MLLLIPIILIALYLGMYLMRNEKTGNCRWRQVGREGELRQWKCQVCQGAAETEKSEPKHCAARLERQR
ncbi:hypothetical protein [Celeribacter litoreus]|uniref:hypothetical protein n=1 Tax=Celeribacter litoreus TaxID=2876714 RepID=UPI001CCDDC6F|nr:hypothetical protein [Celeribacter litoreus]